MRQEPPPAIRYRSLRLLDLSFLLILLFPTQTTRTRPIPIPVPVPVPTSIPNHRDLFLLLFQQLIQHLLPGMRHLLHGLCDLATPERRDQHRRVFTGHDEEVFPFFESGPSEVRDKLAGYVKDAVPFGEEHLAGLEKGRADELNTEGELDLHKTPVELKHTHNRSIGARTDPLCIVGSVKGNLDLGPRRSGYDGPFRLLRQGAIRIGSKDDRIRPPQMPRQKVIDPPLQRKVFKKDLTGSSDPSAKEVAGTVRGEEHDRHRVQQDHPCDNGMTNHDAACSSPVFIVVFVAAGRVDRIARVVRQTKAVAPKCSSSHRHRLDSGTDGRRG
ncbi:BQ5605_C002g01681 [Microbotryum silenes-dioicae]|uniref:BQ5605_C002g01681 protein n=1 Tax=Microbotryum silenes-dioicae TaxID=796604 RepID=A0A2X0M3J4_9BASI|nr:BQ5605_C002g01681 [Microbotryum silenes-dioicae]